MPPLLLNSLPKSGTNLLAKYLRLVGYEGVGDLGSHLVTGGDWLSKFRKVAWRPDGRNFKLGIDSPVEVSRRPIEKKINRLTAGQYLVGHFGYTTDVLDYALSNEVKVLLMLRDPRAVCLSYLHYVESLSTHQLHRVITQLPPEDRLEAVIEGISRDGVILESIHARCESVEAWRQHPDVAVVRFEDLVGERGGGSLEAQLLVSKNLHRDLGLQWQESSAAVQLSRLFGESGGTFRTGSINLWQQDPYISGSHSATRWSSIESYLDLWGYEL